MFDVRCPAFVFIRIKTNVEHRTPNIEVTAISKTRMSASSFNLATLRSQIKPFRLHWFPRLRSTNDYAAVLRALADDHFPQAEKIVLVQDNLNTHSPASLYEAYSPAEAARIRARFEFHFTPKHGSWLNIAELELSALARGCLDRRIPDRPALAAELRAWQNHRNNVAAKVSWQFTTSDARIKLLKLYPSFHA